MLFGGGGAYNHQIKMRPVFNDLFIFDTDREEWRSEKSQTRECNGYMLEVPPQRMHHAAEVFGCVLMVQGGMSGEAKSILGDFALYDLSKEYSKINNAFREINLAIDSMQIYLQESAEEIHASNDHCVP